MKIPKTSTSFTHCPAGEHPALCKAIIDLGTHEESFKGRDVSRRKVRIEWQVPDELDDDGYPYTVGEEYTFSRDERANLRKMLEWWREKKFTESELDQFDIRSILERPCLLQISINAKGYPVIDSVDRLPKGRDVGPLVGSTLLFSLDPAEVDLALLERLPDWVVKKIKSSPEYHDILSAESEPSDHHPVTNEFEDIPF